MGIIQAKAAEYQYLKERLIAAHGDLDDTTLTDTLEGLTDLHEIIAEAVRSALDDEAMVDALRQRLDTMRARLDRLAACAKDKRSACAEAMRACGLKKVATEDLTVSLKAPGMRLNVENTAAIPADVTPIIHPAEARARG